MSAGVIERLPSLQVPSLFLWHAPPSRFVDANKPTCFFSFPNRLFLIALPPTLLLSLLFVEHDWYQDRLAPV